MFTLRHGSLPTMTHCPLLRRLHIRSLAARRGREPPKRTISALQRNQSPLTCTYEYFHAEPAIAQLDWTFTPIPSSSERFADQQRFDPPPIFQRASIWPGIDRRASGLPPMTPSEHTSSLTVNCCGLVGFPSATRINRLTSPMIKTPWGIFLNARLDAAHIIAFTPNQPVPNWFHVLFTSR